MDLICPAGTPGALRAAVEAGADAVYCGFRNETNARNFPGLNFTVEELAAAVDFAHAHGVDVLVAINTFPHAGGVAPWQRAVDDAVGCGADALILADVGLLAYAASRHPGQRLHLSVQAGAASADAIQYYVEAFGIRRAVLPRVLTVPEIGELARNIGCETEAFVFGALCVMAEGRCSLSSYSAGASPNTHGVCAPGGAVSYQRAGQHVRSRLGEFTINRIGPGEAAGYPTPCKGQFVAGGRAGYLFEEPVSLDVTELLPRLKEAGVTAVKIEGRQRSHTYVASVVRSFRAALAAVDAGLPLRPGDLDRLAEGHATTQGAYVKAWR